VRKIYAGRLAAMLAALEASMPRGTTWSRPRGGHTVWVRLPEGVDPDTLMESALAAGIVYTRGDVFHTDGQGHEYLALSFANLSPERIQEGVTILGALVRRGAARVPRRGRRG
jgi:2-aminoadipate transaminase